MAVLTVEGIQKSFSGVDVLRDISFSLEKGEVDIEGKLDSFTYSDAAPGGGHKGESLVSRLFR